MDPRRAGAGRAPNPVRRAPGAKGGGPGARGGARPSAATWGVLSVAVLALALRLPRIAHGLPSFFEEAVPLRTAIEMWEGEHGRIDWNPHLFHYPSLGFYLHVFVQLGVYAVRSLLGQSSNRFDFLLDYLRDPTPMVLASRLVHVLADTGTVLAA